MANKVSLKEITGSTFVLDYFEAGSFFVHEVDTGKRAENLARLLRKIFAGEDRPIPNTGGTKYIEAFKAYKTLEEIKTFLPEVPVFKFDKLIPSYNKACEAMNISKTHPTSDQQDQLFQKFRKFFINITPVIEQEKKVA